MRIVQKLQVLKEWISDSKRTVFFGGAGVSTESGIPDFRSVDGLYNQTFEYPPETIISHSFFLKKPEYFFRFYKEKMLPLGFEANITHKKLALWEQQGKLAAIVTQNIDGLHQKAGSQCVHELHGSVLRNFCMHCGKFYSAEYVKESDGIFPIPDGVDTVKIFVFEDTLSANPITPPTPEPFPLIINTSLSCSGS